MKKHTLVSTKAGGPASNCRMVKLTRLFGALHKFIQPNSENENSELKRELLCAYVMVLDVIIAS